MMLSPSTSKPRTTSLDNIPDTPSNRPIRTFEPIMEESYTKERSSIDRPERINKLVKKNSVSIAINSESAPEKPKNGHFQSVMLQQDSIPLSFRSKANPRTPSSVIDNLNVRSLKKFGTFSGESGKGDRSLLTKTVADSASPETNVNVKFLDKEAWVDDVKCHVCTREFSKINGVFEHHCRTCGKAVCGDCSTKKINENRVCDVCFYHSNNFRAEDRRKDQIKSKNASIKTYSKQLDTEKDDLDSLIKKKYELDKDVREEKEEQTKSVQRLQKERDKAMETLTKKKDNNIKLKETLAVDKVFLKEKEIEFEELKHKINALKTKLTQKKTNYESKKDELLRLQRQKMKYQESPSFINILKCYNNEPTDTNETEELTTRV